ncbi:MAG: zinc-ribbon domain-containing protein [Clostridia bacterium]|nr:zinc-ribbon domain-containing protein [Clostridia bacterium]
MIEKNKQCAFCKALLFDEDDVVHCPVCGAPHHRECYLSSGHCALEHLHGTANEYNPHPENDSGEIPLDREGHVCPKCGKISSSDTIFCPYCGTLFAKNAEEEEKDNFPKVEINVGDENPIKAAMQQKALGGIDKDAKIDGIKAGVIASFVRMNTPRYIPLFAHFAEHKKKRHWNWSAFLFPAAWNAYRKNYMYSAVFAALAICSFLLVTSLAMATGAYLDQLPLDTTLTFKHLGEAFSTVGYMHWILFAVGIGLDLLSRIVCGLYGDSWYKTACFEKMQEIDQMDDPDEAKLQFIRKGGVNQFLGLILLYPSGLMLYQVATLLFQVFTWLMNL